MPAPTVALQVSLKFLQYGATWSENFYSITGQDPRVFGAYLASNPLNVITAFRHPATVFRGVYLRRTDGVKVGGPFLNTQGPSAISISTSSGADLVQTSMPVTINAPNGKSRILWIRGLPDTSTLRNPITGYTDPGVLLNGVQNYVNAIVSPTFAGALQHKIPAPSSGAFSWQTILSLGPDLATPNPNWISVALLGNGIVPPVGSTVYFRGLPQTTFRYLNGTFVVKANTGVAQFQIGATWQTPGSIYHPVNGQVRQYTYQYDAMTTDYSLGQLSTHKTADPTVKRRGKRSPATRRRLPLAG